MLLVSNVPAWMSIPLKLCNCPRRLECRLERDCDLAVAPFREILPVLDMRQMNVTLGSTHTVNQTAKP